MDRRFLGILILGICVLAETPRTAAADPARYRTDSLDPRVRQVPADIQRGVFGDPERYLESLVKFLVADARDDFHKAKILHDWVADNIAYDVDSYFSGGPADSSGPGTLERRRAVCHGYAGLLEQMCGLAAIPCRRILGYGRGYAFSSGQGRTAGQQNHAWNAVHIEGRWHLVDVTWDAGHVEGRSYRRQYATTYLFMEPREFIFTHLPSEPKWQLLATPLSDEQFDRLPYLRAAFFDNGLRLATRLSRVTPVGPSVQFSVRLDRDVDLMAELSSAAGEALPRRTLLQYEPGLCRVFATFPDTGRYRLKLYCRPRGTAGMMNLAADLEFAATSGTVGVFPKTYLSFGQLQGYLHSPLYVPLPTAQPLLFKVRLRDAHDVRLAIGDKPWLPLTRGGADNEVYELTTEIPAAQRVRLNAKLSPEDDSHTTLIDFTAQ
jgi:hypothetical protein